MSTSRFNEKYLLARGNILPFLLLIWTYTYGNGFVAGHDHLEASALQALEHDLLSNDCYVPMFDEDQLQAIIHDLVDDE